MRERRSIASPRTLRRAPIHRHVVADFLEGGDGVQGFLSALGHHEGQEGLLRPTPRKGQYHWLLILQLFDIASYWLHSDYTWFGGAQTHELHRKQLKCQFRLHAFTGFFESSNAYKGS